MNNIVFAFRVNDWVAGYCKGECIYVNIDKGLMTSPILHLHIHQPINLSYEQVDTALTKEQFDLILDIDYKTSFDGISGFKKATEYYNSEEYKNALARLKDGLLSDDNLAYIKLIKAEERTRLKDEYGINDDDVDIILDYWKDRGFFDAHCVSEVFNDLAALGEAYSEEYEQLLDLSEYGGDYEAIGAMAVKELYWEQLTNGKCVAFVRD